MSNVEVENNIFEPLAEMKNRILCACDVNEAAAETSADEYLKGAVHVAMIYWRI